MLFLLYQLFADKQPRQRELETAYEAGTLIDWRITDSLLDPQIEGIDFSGQIFSVDSSWGVEDPATSDITIKITGGVTYGI